MNKNNYRNADLILNVEDFDYDYDNGNDTDSYYDSPNSGGICPDTPLNKDTEKTWTETCITKVVQNATSKTNKNSTFVLRSVLGPGIKNGLTVIVDTLKCGWHSTSIYDGLKVIFHTVL